MAQQIINTGTNANDGNGDPLRTAFTKVNQNFTELYSSAILTSSVGSNVSNSSSNVIVWQSNATAFTQGTFQINSQQVGANNSQNVTLNVSRNTNSGVVNHTAYSTIFTGNVVVVTAYNVDVANVANTANANTIESNIQISVNQLPNVNVIHTISYRLS